MQCGLSTNPLKLLLHRRNCVTTWFVVADFLAVLEAFKRKPGQGEVYRSQLDQKVK